MYRLRDRALGSGKSGSESPALDLDRSLSPDLSFFTCKMGIIPFALMVICVCVLSRFNHVQFFATPWTVACQAPLSMGFSRQEYWSGLPCPSPGDLPHPRIEPSSLKSLLLAGRFFITGLRQQIIRLQCGRPGFNSWVEKIPWRREKLLTLVF